MKVTATAIGYYGGKRRDIGEGFGLYDRAHFSKNWMQPEGWSPDDAEEVPAPKPAPKAAAAPAPKPVQVSTETVVTPPAEPAKIANPITGGDI